MPVTEIIKKAVSELTNPRTWYDTGRDLPPNPELAHIIAQEMNKQRGGSFLRRKVREYQIRRRLIIMPNREKRKLIHGELDYDPFEGIK